MIKATEEKAAHISVGLETALQIAQMHNGNTYVVLIADGQDDDQERTKKIINDIIQKRGIEFYSYFVESLYSDTSQREAFNLTGGIPLSSPIVQSLDWWVTRDMMPYPWYEQESWYKQELGSVLILKENENSALCVTENTSNIVVNEEDDLWNRCHTKEDYQCYLKSYPFGKFSHEARRIIKLFEVKANRWKGLYFKKK